MNSGVWDSCFSISTGFFSVIMVELIVDVFNYWLPTKMYNFLVCLSSHLNIH